MSIADISILTAISAGMLSFLSPCVLPLVPPYLCYMAGVSVEQLRGGQTLALAGANAGANAGTNAGTGGVTAYATSQVDTGTRRQVVLAAVVFTLGFSTVFIALGAGASTIGGLMRRYIDVLAAVGGLAIIAMGLHFLGFFRLNLFNREARFQAGKPATLTGAYVMGLAFAFGWTPCIGPVLAAILGVAAVKDTVGSGAILLAAYSLGLAVPFWLAALFSNRFVAFLGHFRRHLGTVERVMGVLLVATGLLFLTGGMSTIAFWMIETFPVLATIG